MAYHLAKQITILAASVLVLVVMIACRAGEKQPPEPASAMYAFGDLQMKRGINLGNALDAPAPGEWGVTIQAKHFRVIRQAGFDSVRIPVRFSAHVGANPPYAVDESFLAVVDEAVFAGLEEGLVVILDLHHYEELMIDPGGQRERFLAIWQQLAGHYRDAPPNLYFELLNEPAGTMSAETWNEYLEDAVWLIRKSNPERAIIIGGIDFNRIETLDSLRLPDDDHLIATFHFYEPFEFTHQGATWVEGAGYWVGTQWKDTPEAQTAITKQLDRAVEWSAQRRLPLLMGEFGSIASADAASRRRWTAFMARQAEKRNISWAYWDFCAEFRAYDCREDGWDSGLLKALIPE